MPLPSGVQCSLKFPKGRVGIGAAARSSSGSTVKVMMRRVQERTRLPQASYGRIPTSPTDPLLMRNEWQEEGSLECGIECEARHGGTPPAENFSSLCLVSIMQLLWLPHLLPARSVRGILACCPRQVSGAAKSSQRRHDRHPGQIRQ